MKEIIVVWLIHTPAGAIGLIAAAAALFTKKGTALHRKAGTYFTISMLVMLISGFVAALLKESTGDMFLSAVVMYTVFTAWLTAHHKKNETGFLEHVALVWIIVVAIAAFFMNSSLGEVGTPNIYLFWTSFAVFCAIGDVRNLHRAGLSGIQRVIRHVWRIGFSLIWAALALTDKIIKIRGSNVKELPEEQILYIIAVPTMFILIIILYWIINILFVSRKRFASYGD
jgi:hypothetical protein